MNTSWYDYYLCMQKDDNFATFECHRFDTISDADRFYRLNSINRQNKNIFSMQKSTVIPVLKTMPQHAKDLYVEYNVKNALTHTIIIN